MDCFKCGGTGSCETYEGGNRNSYLRTPMVIRCSACDGSGVDKRSRLACNLGAHEYQRVQRGLVVDEVCTACGQTRPTAWGRL